MYENLLRLPYFQGISKTDLTAILDKVKLEFFRYSAGEKIISLGEKCDNIVILIKGEIKAESIAPDGTFRIVENHSAPYPIEPQALFGPSTSYSRNYYAKGDTDILVINKSYFFSELCKHDIFTINLLNMVSSKAQGAHKKIWGNTPRSIEGRIILFIALRTETTTGEKTITIKMERLATELCESRINISRALNHLQDEGLVMLSRKEIHIPDFSKLLKNI